ncbi:BTB/POZ domain-containing protein KCTD19 [Dromaius novaehollandiae]|uniref:BTB/POZ domain-containing protein KCTD19 n=1 Tax=Dromaius novaehollandiae TaxID=8790 RepID=UPI00311E12A6
MIFLSYLKEPGNISESAEEESINFNVGGWHFSIPKSKVAQFPESLLWKEASVRDQSENLRLFIDQDGDTFRHLHYYLQTSKLSFSSCAELNLLYEQALILQLTPLLQILDNLKEEKHNLRVRHADKPIAERASPNYWRTRKCISKPSEIPLKSPAFTGLQERAPLGLMDTPLLDTEEEVNYCFLPLDLVEKYPVLINDDNLLWLLENAAVIECDCSEFRFIVNFLRSEEILLPDDFCNIDVLEEEVVILGIPKLTDAVKIYRGSAEGSENKPQVANVPVRAPLYVMALGLLVKYPDSALGQLYVGSNLGRSKLYISGNGVLFQHVKNWLGTCRLPLTENMSEIQELCAYLDKRDMTYEPMKDALKSFLKQQMPAESRDYTLDAAWTAEVSVCSLHQIVKVYVGSNWYETYLQTLLKYPELLSNDKKVYWITYGQSLLIHGDGQMFRHVLNFLRLGKLFLPSEFKEWPLFRQEAEEYQIPSLLEALYRCDAYRLWIKKHEFHNEAAFPCKGLSVVTWNKEHQFNKDSEEEYSYTAVDFRKYYINAWSKIKDLKGKQDTNGEKAKYSRMISRARGAKRRSKLGGYHKSSDIRINCGYYKNSVSPPRKRGIRSSLTKKLESKDSATPIQKLISPVKEWDVVNSKRCDFQHVAISDGNITDNISQNNTPEKHSGIKGSLALSPGKISYAIEKNSNMTKYEVGAEEKQLYSYMFKQNLPVTPCSGKYQFSTIETTHTMGKTAENRNWEQAEGSFSSEVRDKHLQKKLIPVKNKTMDNEQTNIVLEEHRNVGLILRVEHPPVLGSDGFCTCNEESVVYSILLDGTQLDNSYTQALAKGKEIQIAFFELFLVDTVFLSFALSHEEIFYARKCHCFLTDVILNSVKQKDPKEITAKVVTLVNRLWTLQITPKEFVANLLNTEYFKGDRHIHEELLKWVEVSTICHKGMLYG